MRVASLFLIALLCHVAAAQKPIEVAWEGPLPADLEEGRAILSILRDRMRVLYIQKGNELPEMVSLADLKSDKESLRGNFYTGTYTSVVKGTSDNRYKGTNIAITPLEGVDAPSMILEFESVAKGAAKLTADRESPIVLEGRALLGSLKDRLRVVSAKNNGLAADLDFDDLGEKLDALKGKYFPGDIEVAVAGNADNGFKGTSITIYPLDEVRAAKMSLVFASVSKGEVESSGVVCSWTPSNSEGRRVLLRVGDALKKLYKDENRIPEKADLKTLDMRLDDFKGKYFASEIVIKVKGTAKDAYKGTVVTARELGKGGGYMSIVFENGMTARGAVVMGDGSPDVTEGRAILETISTMLQRKFVKNSKALPENVDLDWIGLPISVLKKVLEPKYYGDDISFKVAGTADDGYKGTTITIKPNKGVDAPIMVLTFESVSTGKSEIKVEE
ncbi:MAG: hypothetical protein IT462_09960 [Planctomycetes bacterium]|nr:hypothetical protein [Planctomycetota bacterium]